MLSSFRSSNELVYYLFQQSIWIRKPYYMVFSNWYNKFSLLFPASAQTYVHL